MGIFDFLRGKKDDVQPAVQATPASSGIQFDPQLINKLQADHKKLLETYTKTQSALEKGDFPAITQHLREFKTALHEHLLTENIKLYAYLGERLASDKATSQIIEEFRTEMQGIGQVASKFLRKYTETPIYANQVSLFKSEFEQIGGALVSRIQREESTLYALYMPNYRI